MIVIDKVCLDLEKIKFLSKVMSLDKSLKKINQNISFQSKVQIKVVKINTKNKNSRRI